MRNKTLLHHLFCIEHQTKNNLSHKQVYKLFYSFLGIGINMGKHFFEAIK